MRESKTDHGVRCPLTGLRCADYQPNIHTLICKQTHMYTRSTHAHVCVYTHAHIRVYTRAGNTHGAHTHTFIYTHMHRSMYTHELQTHYHQVSSPHFCQHRCFFLHRWDTIHLGTSTAEVPSMESLCVRMGWGGVLPPLTSWDTFAQIPHLP